MDGGKHLTDSVVGRDRPRIAIVTRGTRYRASGFLPHAIGPVHALFAYPPNGGHLPQHGGDSPRNSEQFRSATGIYHRVGGRLMVRQTHWEGKPVSGMGRREFIALLGGAAAAWPVGAWAQQSGKVPTIGFLGQGTRSATSEWTTAFVQRLRELGWIDGRNVTIEYRWGEGRPERYAEIAAEFVRLKVDVIVTGATQPTIAAKQATSVIPIVFAQAGDPVAIGLVASLARPAGNATGQSTQTPDLAGKRLEILREVVPRLRRLAIMGNVGNPVSVLELSEVQAAARTLALEVQRVEIQRAQDIAPAIEALNGRSDALYVCIDPLMTTNRIRINTLSLGARLPTMHGLREYVESGGLMSYGPNFPDLYRRAADYVDKILRGAKPGDLPIEQPTKFDLIMNLTTAKALGLEVSPSLLARADEVIE